MGTRPAADRQLRLVPSRRALFMLQLVLPAIVLLVAFQVLPMLNGIVTSFQRARVYELTRHWVGLDNYVAILSDAHFLQVVLPNTLLFMGVSVAVEASLGMGIALLINRKFRLAAPVQTILLLPLMVAPLVSGLMWAWMFNDQFGIINVLIQGAGGAPVAWLTHRWTAFIAIIVAEVWTGTPLFIVILFAALQNQPRETIDAAQIDGANGRQIFWHVTLPFLSPVLTVVLVLRAFITFSTFDVVWAITGGGPGGMTEVFSVYAYKEAFAYMKTGEGSAVAVVGAVIIMAVGLVFYRSVVAALHPKSRTGGP